ncbi:Gfo/Idh/MocA family protein [Chthonobacter albigriseus]|uniref:Gfo/Idh/MocA family protein n=1 Tax=Chthonobacter albigriseus TaxID=1683161 RepID=UPI0015EEB154|nr:Gfo/Idh/MocA family oxidoreductase [Chthonobacter albigriseus]
MRLLILGTGSMATNHARHFAAIDGVTLTGAVDVLDSRVEAFCAGHSIPRGFTSLDEAIAWGEFDAVANVTPDSEHHPTTMKLLRAGKHVFCEKPLATNHADAEAMTAIADQLGLVAMVNLSYRNVPEIQKARDIVLSGQLGGVKHVEASYLQSWLVGLHWGDWRTEDRWLWRLSESHGSKGVLGDVGIHILDFASYGAASEIDRVFCRLKTFHKSDGDRIGEYNLDANDSFTMSVEFGNGALGTVHASRWATGYANTLRLRLYGDKGGLEVQHGFDGSTLRLCAGEDVHTQTWRDVQVEPVPTNYERFVAAVAAGRTTEPSFATAARLQKVIDLGIHTETTRVEETA